MFGKALSYESQWDFVNLQSVAENQRWILSAMQNHGQGLITMLWRLLGNEQDVCDAYQNTFLQLAHHEGGKKPQNVKAYVYRTANNVAISMLRRRIIERKNLHKPITIRSTFSSPAEEFDSKDLQENLRSRIAQLPEHLRNVITMRDLAELSYEQIGRIMGISAGTARVYRCKAIRLLTVWMCKEEQL
jgi:RNA polymerase sigma-70 factor (ECF subfamily)